MKPAFLLVAAVLCLSGCGVTTQDEPEPITTLVPTATPTVSSRSVPPTPCTAGPESSGSRQVQSPPAPTE
ncbi:hypothetical protein SAMN04489733_1079 [Amycolatopsis keratiniphila]|nr:hypothetical protein SAMN04489733_1079 [Amycolatopsis keratiniphila]